MLKYWSILADGFCEYICTDYTSCYLLMCTFFTNGEKWQRTKWKTNETVWSVLTLSEKFVGLLVSTQIVIAARFWTTKHLKKIISRSSKKFWRKYFEIVFWAKPLFKCHAMNIFYFPGFGVCSLLSRWFLDHSMAIKRMPWNIIKVHSQIIDVHKKKWWQMRISLQHLPTQANKSNVARI